MRDPSETLLPLTSDAEAYSFGARANRSSELPLLYLEFPGRRWGPIYSCSLRQVCSLPTKQRLDGAGLFLFPARLRLFSMSTTVLLIRFKHARRNRPRNGLTIGTAWAHDTVDGLAGLCLSGCFS